MKAKVLLPIQFPESPSSEADYTWRPDWVTPHESIYSIFSKFAYLNGMGLQSMVSLFVQRVPRGKVTTTRQNGFDMSDHSGVDEEVLKTVLGLSESQIKRSFLTTSWNKALFPWCEQFRFCPSCIAIGYHSTLHQLMFLTKCPAHKRRLTAQCPECGGCIAYRFSTSLSRSPFCCPHCECSLSPRITEFYEGYPVLHPRHQQRMELLWNVLTTDRQQINGLVNCFAHPVFSASVTHGHQHRALERRREEFLDFLIGIDSVVSKEQGQLALSDRTLLQLKSAPMPIGAKSRVIAHNSCRKRPWFNQDHKFWSILPIYKAILRHIKNHVLARHRPCIERAISCLWWHMDGRSTEPICPYAYAFIMWRMFWEETGTPHQLAEPPGHAPYRILAWLSDAAPYCPNIWAESTQEWIRNRIFASDCLATFNQWLARADHVRRKRKHWLWSRSQGGGHMVTYWAALEDKRRPRSIKLLIEPIKISDIPALDCKFHEHIAEQEAVFENLFPYDMTFFKVRSSSFNSPPRHDLQ